MGVCSIAVKTLRAKRPFDTSSRSISWSSPGSIWKKLQAKLAQNQVEGLICEGYIQHAGFQPFDGWSRGVEWPRSRHRQHARVYVEAKDAARAHGFRRETRDDTRATGDIEHPLAGLRCGTAHQIHRP